MRPTSLRGVPSMFLVGVAVALLTSTSACGSSSSTRTVTQTLKSPAPKAGSKALVVVTPKASTRERIGCPSACDDFETPTTNIKCMAYGGDSGGMDCDIASGVHPKPVRRQCEFGDLAGLGVPSTGLAGLECRTDVSQAVLDKRIPVLSYGESWHGFGMTCLSQTAGLTCVNVDGHGFFLARERWRIF
jgi:hypothetical protein